MPNVDDVLTTARTHLNDDNAINWPDDNILPKFRAAFQDLQVELTINDVEILTEVSSELVVPAGTTDLTTVTGYPTDLISPTWLKEKQTDEDISFYIDMTPVDFIPMVAQDVRLVWWSWAKNKVLLLGALNNVDVTMRYQRRLTVPTLLSDDVVVLLSESYLAYQTAALCFQSAKDYRGADRMFQMAAFALDRVINTYITRDMQIMPTKRRAYHRRNAFRDIARNV